MTIGPVENCGRNIHAHVVEERTVYPNYHCGVDLERNTLRTQLEVVNEKIFCSRGNRHFLISKTSFVER